METLPLGYRLLHLSQGKSQDLVAFRVRVNIPDQDAGPHPGIAPHERFHVSHRNTVGTSGFGNYVEPLMVSKGRSSGTTPG